MATQSPIKMRDTEYGEEVEIRVTGGRIRPNSSNHQLYIDGEAQVTLISKGVTVSFTCSDFHVYQDGGVYLAANSGTSRSVIRCFTSASKSWYRFGGDEWKETLKTVIGKKYEKTLK